MDLMFGDSVFCTFIVFMCTFFMVFLITRRQSGVPPGPSLFPIVGNMPSLMSSDTLSKIGEMRKRYGDIFALYIGGRLTIFLNGFEAINDAFKKQGTLFKERPHSPFYNDKGIIFTNGETWKDQRGFAQKAIYETGFGANIKYLDEIIDFEICKLIDKIGNQNGATDVEKYLNVSISNVILQLLCSHRYDIENVDINTFLSRLRTSANRFFVRDAVLSCFPFLKFIPKLNVVDTSFEHQLAFIDQCISKGKEGAKSESRNIVRMYLEKEHENRIEGLQNTFDSGNLRVTALQLLSAGSETSACSVMWILLHLIRQPQIQDKMAAEMTDILGTEVLKISDRKLLPYNHAVVLEGLRIACVAPLGIPHSVPDDVMFHGFLFPKNCTVLANLSSCLKDPHVWKEPEEFRPDRFLCDNEGVVIVPKEFVPFSLGPRSCLGETLARNEIFLFVTNIVRKFKLYSETDDCLPDSKGVLGVTYHPVPFKIRFVSR